MHPDECTGAMCWRLNSELVASTVDCVASLWFVASCLVAQPGSNAHTYSSITHGQELLLWRALCISL